MAASRTSRAAVALVVSAMLLVGVAPSSAGASSARPRDLDRAVPSAGRSGPLTSDVAGRRDADASPPFSESRRLEAVEAPAGLAAQAGTTTAPDAYENDDTAGTARALAIRPFIGNPPYTEDHTIDTATGVGGAASWDEDWYSFTVTEDDIRYWGFSVTFETWSQDPWVDTVIEVYNETSVTAAADPTTLPDLRGGGPAGNDPDGFTDPDPNAYAWADEEPWFAGHAASCYFFLDPRDYATLAGTYYVRVRPYYQGDFPDRPAWQPIGFDNTAGAYQLRYKEGMAQRLAAGTRYDTSARISQERYPDGFCDGYYLSVASGKGFADALAGSTLAGAAGGPLLLTDPNTLPASIDAEIRRLVHTPPLVSDQGTTTVFVLGGTGAVSSAVENAIAAIPGVEVERVAGSSRYETAANIARRADSLLSSIEPTWGVPGLAFVVSGRNFPDALAASPMATWNAAPILLTQPTYLSSETLQGIRDLGVTDVIIIGGTGAVSSAVENSLVLELGDSQVDRIAGGSRYQTGRLFAEWAGDLEGDLVGVDGSLSGVALWPLYPELVGLASGRNFPDALAGGVLCGHAGYPLLLNDLMYEWTDTWKPEAYWYLEDGANGDWGMFFKSYAFGGTGAIAAWDYFVFDWLTLPWWVEDAP